MLGCQKKYTDPSSLRKHVKNHSNEEQEQIRQSRDPDTSQEGGGWLEQTALNYDYSLAQYDSQAFRRQQEVTHVRRGRTTYLQLSDHQTDHISTSAGMMVHQPNSLDSLDGEAPLPFDPVPIRYESSPGDPGGLLPRIDEQTNIFSMK